ncbi:MAG: phage portal protein [Planctomycetaceae bacterium]|nr:phage portal protein [Planctomycetaceae bacterium]
MSNTELMQEALRLEEKLLESLKEFADPYLNAYIDPREPYFDDGNDVWLPSGGQQAGQLPPFGLNEQSLCIIRQQCRQLVLSNEFAINAIENRINFVVGNGHKYHAIPKTDDAVLLAEKTREIINGFLHENNWHRRQQEIVRRRDRDGEAFLRFFCDEQGKTLVRFVEPDQVATPPEFEKYPHCRFGIRTKPNDVESVEGYWIDGEFVKANEIQHRKANVDGNVKRGIPIFFPVRKNMQRAEKLLRNMSVVAEIQSAIALIRKHVSSSGETIRRYVQNQSERNTHDAATGRTGSIRRFSPGTIIDAHQGVDYHFPVAAIDASRYVLVLQAELRAIASRLVMPEFMLSSDASNANYSSTMVAEGPAVRMFERMQYEMIDDDLRVLRRVIGNAVLAGKLPPDVLRVVDLQAIPPLLAVRDRLNEARADEILLKHGVMSPQTMAMRYGLDPKLEASLACRCCHSNNER